jgi:twitching motility protein PilJ
MDAIKPRRPRAEKSAALSDTDTRATIELRAPRSEFNFANLPVSIKLALIVLLLAVPLLFFVVQTLQRQAESTRILTQDSKGVVFLQNTARLFDLLGQYRANSSIALSGDQKMNLVSSQGDQISLEIDRLIADNQQSNDEFGVTELFNNLKTDWLAIRQSLASMSSDISFQRQSDLIQNRFLPIVQQVGEKSGLILGSQLDESLIQNLLIKDLPATIEAFSQLAAYGEGLLARKKVTDAEKAVVTTYLDRAKTGRDKVAQDIAEIVATKPDLRSAMQIQMEKVSVNTSSAVRRVLFDIVEPVALSNTPKQYTDAFAKGIASYGDLYRFNIDSLQKILLQRTLDLQRSGLANLLLLIGLFLLALLFTGLVVNSITTPLNDMGAVVQKFGAGDLSQLIPVRSRDELGKLAGSFNNSILQLRDFLGRQEEDRLRNIQLQSNIGEFLNVAMDISGGDLTKKGKVTEDVLGNVVDAINLMTEEIGYLLKDVQDATKKVSLGANSVTQVSQGIVIGAQNQTDIARLAQEQTTKVTTSMVQMSDDAQKASLSATQALEASQAGQQAVLQTLDGMQGIRREVQNISKGIKSLSDRSLEISEIVDTISQITRQTNLIALNAAIEASGAGEAGARFAIVADEVRNLAENAAKATLSITGLIKTIQLEVQAAVVGVENGTREVEEGYRIATGAGERLQEISVLTAQSAAFAEGIAASTRIQVHQINNVAQAVQEIAGTANQTASDSQQGQVSAQGLVKLSEQLTQSLSRFQLPN